MSLNLAPSQCLSNQSPSNQPLSNQNAPCQTPKKHKLSTPNPPQQQVQYQRTLARVVGANGIGLHSGKQVQLTLKPADDNTGICFVRSDLDNQAVALDAFLIQDTKMSSNLCCDGVKIGTIEHLLSALSAMGVDNVVIVLSSGEVPIMDGSAIDFIRLIEQAGLVEQNTPKQFIQLTKTVTVRDGNKWARLSPYESGFRVHFEIDFAHPVIKATAQSFVFDLSSERFIEQIAKARTFGFINDLAYLKQHNLALGGSLDNAIVLDDNSIMNPEGLRYDEEFVRHKILDVIGDLYVAGRGIIGRFDGYKSGHMLNNRLIRAVLSDPNCFKIVTFYNNNDCPIDYYPAKIEPSAQNDG